MDQETTKVPDITQMFVWRGPMSIDPFWYTTRFTLEWSPSMRGPKKNPEPKSEREMDGKVLLRLLVLRFLKLLWGLDTRCFVLELRGQLWRKHGELLKAMRPCMFSLGLPVCQQRKISNDFYMPFTLSHKMVWKIRGCGSFIRKRCQVIKMFSLVIFSSNISYEISNK